MAGFTGALGTLAINLVANVDEYLTAIADVADQTDKAIDAMDKKFQGLQSVGMELTGLGASLTAAITAPIAGLTALSVQAAGDFDSLMRGLTAVAGSSEEAEKQMARLKEVAKLPGLGLEEAVQGSIRLQAVGVSATEAERQMMAFGNALATVGKGKADLDGVIAQLVQMSSKSQVLASDLRPIMERVPQAATIIKEAYGTIDTEVIQKAGIGTQQLIETVVSGLEKLPKVSGGIKNSFENLGDSLNQALVKIGNLFVPLIEKVTPMIEGLVVGLGQVAEWFKELPAPVQAAVGGIVAFAAALGPIITAIGGITLAVGAAMPALTALAGFFGTSVAMLGPWALAIAGITAALAALGAWVYENWEPIVAVLTQAWDGLSELWGRVWLVITAQLQDAWKAILDAVNAVWQPILNFFLKIWDAVGPYFVAAWDMVRNSLTTVWNAILDTANKVWSRITGLFQTFLEWAAKIPGASKLMTLTEAWEGAKRLNTEVEKTNTVLPKATDNIAKLGTEGDKTAWKLKPVAFHINALEQAIKDEQAALLKGHQEFRKWMEAHQDAESRIPKVTEVSDELNTSINRIIGSMKNVPPAFLDAEAQAKTSMQGAVTAVQTLDTAYKTLGVTSSATLAKQATDSEAAYNTILTDANASILDIQKAWVAMEEANIAATRAAGGTITAERQKALEDMKTVLDTELPKQKSAWEGFGNQVSTIITNFAQDIAKSLFDGDMSWGEKCKSMLKSLGEAVTSSFIEPATKAIGKFISETITDLLSGKGLGGVLDSIKGIGESITGIFKSTPSTPSVPTGGGGGGGGAGLGGAALGGALGWANLGVSIASGLVSFFQGQQQEKTMNAVEHNTRYSMMYLGERADGGILGVLFRIQENTQFLQGQLDIISAQLTTFLEPAKNDIHSILEKFYFAQTRLDEISSNTYWGLQSSQDLNSTLGQIRDLLSARPQSSTVTINTYGSDPKVVASSIAGQLRLQGGVA